MLTSRMPALKAQAGVSEGEIGLLLLSLGLSALVMLLMSSLLVTKFGSRRVLGWGSLVCMAGIPVAAFAADFWVLWGAFILFGFGMGLWDVSMNVQGMGVERRYSKSSMLILHASYSTGSVIGAASGAFFAAAELAVVPHFLTVFVVYLAVRAWAKTKLYEDQPAGGAAKKSGSIFGLPLIVYVFGLMAACAYASEGSAAEWGSLLLHSVKGADEDIAALAFACVFQCHRGLPSVGGTSAAEAGGLPDGVFRGAHCHVCRGRRAFHGKPLFVPCGVCAFRRRIVSDCAAFVQPRGKFVFGVAGGRKCFDFGACLRRDADGAPDPGDSCRRLWA